MSESFQWVTSFTFISIRTKQPANKHCNWIHGHSIALRFTSFCHLKYAKLHRNLIYNFNNKNFIMFIQENQIVEQQEFKLWVFAIFSRCKKVIEIVLAVLDAER